MPLANPRSPFQGATSTYFLLHSSYTVNELSVIQLVFSSTLLGEGYNIPLSRHGVHWFDSLVGRLLRREYVTKFVKPLFALCFFFIKIVIHGGKLEGRSGSLQAGINLEFPSITMARLDVSFQGINGELPNLDLINTIARLAKKHSIPLSIHGQVSSVAS